MQNKELTNYEVWCMLKNKMEKNGFVPLTNEEKLVANRPTYLYDDVICMVSLAYRSGYERAMKGRPFKISEKKGKKRGHWEPIDPENLPKEGTKVRYSRESEEYVKEPGMINVGDIGVFSYGKILGLPGIRFDDGRFWDWVSFGNEPECLDMWVEDDE